MDQLSSEFAGTISTPRLRQQTFTPDNPVPENTFSGLMALLGEALAEVKGAHARALAFQIHAFGNDVFAPRVKTKDVDNASTGPGFVAAMINEVQAIRLMAMDITDVLEKAG